MPLLGHTFGAVPFGLHAVAAAAARPCTERILAPLPPVGVRSVHGEDKP
jgi:hypothetical protein